MNRPTLDEIGAWSEIKLNIIREYAKSYSQILAKHQYLHHRYIDGFAGAGLHVAKRTQKQIAGSPLNVISVEPKFREYHLVEVDRPKADHLRKLFRDHREVIVHDGDCNDVVLNKLLPEVTYKSYKRALCLLDPYGLHLDWTVVFKAGQMKTIDLLLNFPMMDMNMNALWNDPTLVKPSQAARMTRYWGDDSWKASAYSEEETLFGPRPKKATNEEVAEAFAKRLKDVAGFKFVADPLPMRNSTQATVYFLFFASQNKTAHKIVSHIFERYRAEGGF